MIARVSDKGARFVGRFEGFRSCAYRDSVGTWTIGFGTTSAVRPVGPGTPCISEATGRKWLKRALNKLYLPHVPRIRRLKRRERDALASFAYNLGPRAVNDPSYSTLARRLRSPEGKSYEKRKRIYREELPKWNKAGGVSLPGLTKRRAAEVRLACEGDYSSRP